VEHAIRGLPETYARLRLRLAACEQAGERVSGSREAPIPLATDVEAFMAHIVYVTLRWEEYVRAEARLAELPDGRRRDGVALAAASLTLQRHLSTLLALGAYRVWRPAGWARADEIVAEHGDAPHWQILVYDLADQPWEARTMDGTAAGLEFLAINGQARGTLGLSRQRRRITEVRCDLCKGKATLVQYEARDGGWEPRVRCTACPNAYVGAAYDLLMGRVYQAQLDALATAS
jgi:hypothetical protein